MWTNAMKIHTHAEEPGRVPTPQGRSAVPATKAMNLPITLLLSVKV